MYGVETLILRKRRSEIPGKFWNAILENDGEDHLGRSCEKTKKYYKESRTKKYRSYNKKREG